jgi:nitrite reductase/ring-hydroxylating ferredoxin subunit
MQSWSNNDESPANESVRAKIPAGLIDEFPPGRVAAIETPSGDEVALYNVNGELYATENFCPHRGAPLTEGFLCGHVIECGLHGWQFDVRSGKCLTLEERIETYPVVVEDGVIKIEVKPKRREGDGETGIVTSAG